MPTLEGALRAAVKVGLANELVDEVKGVLKQRREACRALLAACERNDEVALTKAMVLGRRNGVSSRLMEDAQRRLDGIALAKQRAQNIDSARKMRDAHRDAHRKTAPASEEKPDAAAAEGKRTTKRQPGFREAHVPLLSLARTPLEALKELVPKKLPLELTWEKTDMSAKTDVSAKTGALFLKGAQHLCERTAEGQLILEANIRAAASGDETKHTLAVERITHAHSFFVSAQKCATSAYGVLHMSTMGALDQWLLASQMPEETVTEVRQGLCEAQKDLSAAADALVEHRARHSANAEANLLQCRDDEGVARALLMRGRARLSDLGMPMSDEAIHQWDVAMLASRLERLGHFLHQPRTDLDFFNVPIARVGVARALAVVKTLVRLDEDAPDPIVDLLLTVLEVMDHPLVQGTIFATDTTFAVGSKAAVGPGDFKPSPRKPASPKLPQLSHSLSAPLLEEEFLLPQGLFVGPTPLRRPTGSAGRLPSLEEIAEDARMGRNDNVKRGQLRSSSSTSSLRSVASQPALVVPPPHNHRIAPAELLMMDGASLDRQRRTTPARSKFYIAVDESLEGAKGSGRVLYDELTLLVKDLETRLNPPRLAADEIDLDPSGIARVLIKGMEAWVRSHTERERQRYLAREIAVAEAKEKKRAAAFFTYTPLDEAEAKMTMETLRKALAANLERTMDFFRDCDTDQSGTIDRREFRRALDKVVPGVTKGVCAALFDLIDTDKSNSIEYEEIHAQLRQREEFRPQKKGAPPREPRPRTGLLNARLELYHKKMQMKFDVKSRGRHMSFT